MYVFNKVHILKSYSGYIFDILQCIIFLTVVYLFCFTIYFFLFCSVQFVFGHVSFYACSFFSCSIAFVLHMYLFLLGWTNRIRKILIG